MKHNTLPISRIIVEIVWLIWVDCSPFDSSLIVARLRAGSASLKIGAWKLRLEIFWNLQIKLMSATSIAMKISRVVHSIIWRENNHLSLPLVGVGWRSESANFDKWPRLESDAKGCLNSRTSVLKMSVFHLDSFEGSWDLDLGLINRRFDLLRTGDSPRHKTVVSD